MSGNTYQKTSPTNMQTSTSTASTEFLHLPTFHKTSIEYFYIIWRFIPCKKIANFL